MSYPIPKHRIDEIVAAPKVRPETQPLKVEKHGEHGAKFQIVVDLMDGPFVDLRYLGKAAMLIKPTSYDASLIVAAERVRGIGFMRSGGITCAPKNEFRRAGIRTFVIPICPRLTPSGTGTSHSRDLRRPILAISFTSAPAFG